MSIQHPHPFPALGKLAAAAALAVLPMASQAVSVGISPSPATPVVNPFTGQETTVWKLVGKGGGGCTAYLITPQWVMTANHCAGTFGQGFVNEHIAPGLTAPTLFGQTANVQGNASWPICVNVIDQDLTDPTKQYGTDMFICRLANPAPFASAGPFPPLVAGPLRGPGWPTLPTYEQLADRTAKWGSLMLYGRAGPDLLNFVRFNGTPFNYSPISDPLGATIPELNGGDSGGAVFSFSPTTGQPAFAGITTHPLQFFSDGAIKFIQDHIAAYGDTPPASVTTASHYGDPAARSAADLTAVPTGAGLSGTNFNVRWTAPADSSVTSYSVSYGRGGAVTGRVTVGASSGNQLAIPVGSAPTGMWTACVQPVNAHGAGNIAWVSNRFPGQKAWATPNCATFDLTPPGPVTSVTMASALDARTGVFKVSASWPATATPGVLISGYRVNATISHPTGPKRTLTQDVATPGWSTSTVSGATVCASVAAVNKAGVVGPFSASQCKKAQ